MQEIGTQSIVMIVAAVLLFFLLGIAILVLIDHKSRLPGGFTSNPFSITGIRRDHPVIAFLTTIILFSIITVLILELGVAAANAFGFGAKKEAPKILTILSEERSAEKARHFHNLPKKFLPTQGRKNICFHCHGDFPHSKEPMIRTILNMHSQFSGCMTCHADPRSIPEDSLKLSWLNYSGIEVEGVPFGTDINHDTGDLVDTDDFYSKIVAYQVNEDSQVLLEITSDDSRYREFVKIKDSLSDADKTAVKKRYHKNVSPKGRFCSKCHREEKKSYMPFRELGFSDRRIHDLTNLNIIGLIEKYKGFYLSSLLTTDKSIPSVEALTGSKRENTKKQEMMREDPRTWWKKMYDSPNKK